MPSLHLGDPSQIRLLHAAPDQEDAITLLQAAARDYVPVDPNNKGSVPDISSTQAKSREVPEPGNRPSIESVIDEIRQQEWYSDQIAFDRTVAAKEGQRGGSRRCSGHVYVTEIMMTR